MDENYSESNSHSSPAPEEAGNEHLSVPEHKREYIRVALQEVDEFSDEVNVVRAANVDYHDKVGLSLNRLKLISTNTNLRDPEARGIQAAAEKFSSIGSALSSLTETTGRFRVPKSLRDEIQKNLIYAVSVSNVGEARKKGEETVQVFTTFLNKSEAGVDSLRQDRSRIGQAAENNEEEARRIAARFPSEASGEFKRASGILVETVDENDRTARGKEQALTEKTRQRREKFRDLVDKIVEPDQPPSGET